MELKSSERAVCFEDTWLINPSSGCCPMLEDFWYLSDKDLTDPNLLLLRDPSTSWSSSSDPIGTTLKTNKKGKFSHLQTWAT